jgi:hypothetical protein
MSQFCGSVSAASTRSLVTGVLNTGCCWADAGIAIANVASATPAQSSAFRVLIVIRSPPKTTAPYLRRGAKARGQNEHAAAHPPQAAPLSGNNFVYYRFGGC